MKTATRTGTMKATVVGYKTSQTSEIKAGETVKVIRSSAEYGDTLVQSKTGLKAWVKSDLVEVA